MKLIKASALTAILVSSLIGTSIPSAISAPAGSKPTTVDRSKQPRIPSSIINIDGNPNGAQVRILFKLREGEKLVCSDVNITVTTKDDSTIPPAAPGGLVGTGLVVNEYKGKMFASTSDATSTCLYNFALKQNDIKKTAYISISGTHVNTNTSLVYSGLSWYDIKNIKQTFRTNGSIVSTQVN